MANKTVTVVQGEYAISRDPGTVMWTILGSCVAVCLYDTTAKIGGMNHFLLAGHNHPRNDDLKYGVNAMELLINKVLRGGGDRRRLQAKLFGGARMTDHGVDIGASNAEFASTFLEQEGIPCVAKSLGGLQARKVQFFPTTGAARQMMVANEQVAPIKAPSKPAANTEAITLF